MITANELANALDTIGDKYLVILGDIEFKKAADFVRQQQAEIEKVNAEWVQAAMALGKCVQENHDLKAEIAILRKAQEK